MRKYLGLDVGDVRIGVSKSDPMGILATPLEVINRNEKDPVKRIAEILIQEKTKKIVVGLPKSLDGTVKRQVEKVNEFITELKSKIEDLEIFMVDERYSTVEAEHYLRNYSKRNPRERRQVVDMVAATIILQKFLDMGK